MKRVFKQKKVVKRQNGAAVITISRTENVTKHSSDEERSVVVKCREWKNDGYFVSVKFMFRI